MSLQNINIQDRYRSDDGYNLIEDFYIPCLSKTTLYSRAVGYFSSTSIVAISRGLSALIEGGGKMRLVASPKLSRDDIKAIEKGLKLRDEVVSKSIIKEFEIVAEDRLACLSWLLSESVLDIKIAIVDNISEPGLYHEKFGIFTDENNNEVAFVGSANETLSGLQKNFENILVFCSWKEASRVETINEDFERLWSNNTNNAEVIDFPEAAARKLLEYRPYTKPSVAKKSQRQQKSKLVAGNRDDYKLDENKKQSHNLDITLRPYQEESFNQIQVC